MNTHRALTADWSAILGVIADVVDVDATAREYKAFRRPREIKNAGDLLRLALAYGGGLGSYRTLAAWALAVELADLSDVAILKRLRGAADWLCFLAGRLLAVLFEVPQSSGQNRPIRIIDASCITKPGSMGTDFRLHAVFDPARLIFTQLELTDAKGGERLDRFTAAPNEIWLADRGYVAVHGLSHARAAGADFVVRITHEADQGDVDSGSRYGRSVCGRVRCRIRW